MNMGSLGIAVVIEAVAGWRAGAIELIYAIEFEEKEEIAKHLQL